MPWIEYDYALDLCNDNGSCGSTNLWVVLFVGFILILTLLVIYSAVKKDNPHYLIPGHILFFLTSASITLCVLMVSFFIENDWIDRTLPEMMTFWWMLAFFGVCWFFLALPVKLLAGYKKEDFT